MRQTCVCVCVYVRAHVLACVCRGVFSHLGAQVKPSHWGPPHPRTALTKVLFSPQHKVFNAGSSK